MEYSILDGDVKEGKESILKKMRRKKRRKHIKKKNEKEKRNRIF
jgi:hypothetical protein